ncbi:putative phosphonate catabolism associated alcohol dehydrogenase [Agromyces sp. CF514]|uniref:alcohol dehydrogenase catalytic domain-containing protein n=1 Tax=Agromyces sp. CF514 TaxID=1881031 RepID=UPI0008ECF198|nr:alcohol dehydrogenase catalytic domain-containing protein [Agromyces sp. CF514]SFR91733.1 putative phosphonate catabolism associated alcohol dehydrogenase [Agromyces sp. CF514]
MHTVDRLSEHDVIVKPSPVAMVWSEPGRAQEALAVPGVHLCDGEALVEVELATICGADIHTVLGHRPARAPLVLGHEQVGRVVAIGAGAMRSDGSPLELGDRVVWSVTVSCGTCDRCRRGLTQKCRTLAKYGHERVHRGWELSGGFATHVQLRAGTAIVRISEDVPAVVAAPASCATATAVAALAAASDRVDLDGAVVLVTGGGMLGLTAAALALDAGATVIVSEPDADRRAFARRLGALSADPRARADGTERLESVLAAALGGTGEGGGAGDAREVLVAIEASGAAAGVRTAVAKLGVGGVAVLAGSVTSGTELCVDPESIVRRLVTLTGVHNYDARHLELAVAFLERAWRTLPLDELVGSTHALAKLDVALDEAASGRHIRVGVAPGRRVAH